MIEDPLQHYGVSLLLAAFHRMGVFLRSSTRYNCDALADQLGIIPEYSRLFYALLNILSRASYLESRDGEFQTTPAVEASLSKAELDLLGQRLVESRPELTAHADCLRVCLDAYPDILTGKRSHMQVLFPNGSLTQIEVIYKSDAVADTCGRLSAVLIASYIQTRQEIDTEAPIRILEVGAGTGAATTLILPQLAELSANIEFVYSDLSPAFLEHGRRCFGQTYPFMRFLPLDLERPPKQQSFSGNEFDLIFAGNVLHATQNIRQTLAHLKWLLRRNGLLLINEVTSVHDFATLLFGLTSGWWRYQDETERIPDSPLVSAQSWQRLLAESGFINTEELHPTGVASTDVSRWSVLVGESDGRIGGLPTAAPVVSRKDSLKAKSAAPAAARADLLNVVREVFAEVLRIPRSRIHPDTTFEKFGVDSLVALELNKRFERDFGTLPATLLFEYNTAAKVAAYLGTLDRPQGELESMSAELSPLVAPSAPQPEWQLVRKDEGVISSRSSLSSPPSLSSCHSPQPLDIKTELIAIIGLSGRYPLADDLFTYWENLRNGRNCVRPFPPRRLADLPVSSKSNWFGGFLDAIDQFDPQFFGIAPSEAEYIDPQERLWLETSWHAIEDAGYSRAGLVRMQSEGLPVGVFVGCMYQQYPLVTTDPDTAARLGTSGHWSMANRTSYLLNLQGPSVAVDTACSSSLTAIHLACESLRRGECGAAIAGGVNLTIHPGKFDALRAVGMLAFHTESRAFGDSAGLIPGEGVGAVLLKPLGQAIADGDFIYAVIQGSAINHGGKTGGYRVPSPEAQGDLIRRALQVAGISPESVSYIEAAANGSPLGDAIEIAGLQRGFSAVDCRIGSVKSNLGHLEAASGISQLTKVIGQFREGILYPTIHTQPQNPRLGLEQTQFHLVSQVEPWVSEGPRRAAISSFGAGGANAHLIVDEYVAPARTVEAATPELVLLSGHSIEQLREQCERLVAHLRRLDVNVELVDLAYTLQTGREALTERLAVVVSTIEELCSSLERYLDGDPSAVYQGSQPEDSELAQLLEGEAGRAFLERLHENHDLSRCARLWVSGVEIDWTVWHCGRSVRRVPLPGYPFARRRCWIEASSLARGGVLHPLVHGNTSTLSEQSYCSRFSGQEVFLAEHRVLEEPVLPAAALIEMARAAAEMSAGCPIRQLRQLSWTKPLRVTGNTPVDVEIRLQPQVSGGIAFTIWLGGEQLAAGLADSTLDARVEEPCPVSEGAALIAPEVLYGAFAQAGLALGPHFRTLQSIRRSGDVVYAQLALPTASDSGFYLTPGLLDGVLQTLAGFRDATAEALLEVPFWIDKIEIYAPLTDSVKVRGCRSFGQENCYDLTVWQLDGSMALCLRGVQTRQLVGSSVIDTVEKPASKTKVPIEPLLLRLVGEILKLAPAEVPRTRNFLDFGFDSSSLVLFTRRINEALGIDLSPAELFARPTIAQLAQRLEQYALPNSRFSSLAVAAPPSPRLDPEPIAIVGMAGVFPGSRNLAEFWQHLVAGDDLISEVPAQRWDWQSLAGNDPDNPNPSRWGGFLESVDLFDSLFFGISPREAALMDPQQRLFLEVVWHAIEDSGYRPSQMAGTRTGLYVGVATSDYGDLLRQHASEVESQMATGIAHSILANRISYLLDLRGPSQPVDTACSSSLVAIHHAVEAIRQGNCEMAIAGGVNVILSPILSMGFGKAGFMSPSGRCRAFAKEADGYVRGEGVSAILLKPLSRAIADRDHIYATIRGTAVNHGGRSASLTAPNAEAQTELLLSAWQQAGVPASTINYIEAHGTGTALGDPIEILGLKEARQRVGATLPCWVGSVKSNVGHLETASGIAGVLKTVLALQHHQIPASLHVDEVNPYLPTAGTSIEIVRETIPWPTLAGGPRRAGVSSFGFGGTNAHVVLEEAPQAVEIPLVTNPMLAVLSARNEERLRVYAAELASFLECTPTLSLADVIFTLYYGREEMEVRWQAQVRSLDDLVEKLRALEHGQLPNLAAHQAEPPSLGRRISLPGYPFAPERHWFSGARTFTVTLDPHDQRIAHHLVGGQRVCAGALLIDITLNAIAPKGGLGIAQWTWVEPLVVADEPVRLKIHLSGDSIRVDSAGGKCHARGELSRPRTWESRQLQVPALTDGIGAETLYDTFAAQGVTYGPWYRRLSNLRENGDGEVWSYFHRPKTDSQTPPADLLDAAWQAACFIRLRTQPGLPFALTDLSWSGPMPAAGWIHVQHSEGRLRVEIADEVGNVAVRLGDLVLRGWSRSAQQVIAVPHRRTESTAVQSASPAIEAALELSEESLMLIPIWDVVAVKTANMVPSRTEHVVIVGGSNPSRSAIQQLYPEAHLLEIKPTDSPEVIAQALKAQGQLDHLLWIAPNPSIGSIADEALMEMLIEEQKQGVLFCFRLLKALLHLGYGAKHLGWTAITTQTQAIHQQDAIAPTHASVHGLMGSMAKEYPNWTVRLVDLETNQDWPLEEIFTLPSNPQGDAWVYRDRQWYRQQLLGCELAESMQSVYQPKGVYVVIGGAGGIGEAFSEYLIRRYQAQLIWIGRREKDATIQAKLDRLAAFGPAPHYIAADAGNLGALAQAHQEIKACYGSIQGVVHAAIVLSDKSLTNMEEERFKSGLSEKVDVSVRLAQVFTGEPLDFVLFFSSIQTFAKAPGQSNYAAGCTFKDAFAAWLSRCWPCPVKVINWGYWGSVGIVASEAYQERMARLGIGSIKPAEAMAALEKLLSEPITQAAFLKTIQPDAVPGVGLSLNKGEGISIAPHQVPSVSDRLSHGIHPPIAPSQVIPPNAQEKLRSLDVLVAKALWGQLQSLGLFVEFQLSISKWQAAVSLPALYKPWLEESLAILAAQGYLSYDGEACTVIYPTPIDMAAIWSEWDKHKVTWLEDPFLKAHVVLEAMLRALPEILTGKRPATEILFPNASMELVEAVYKNNPVFNYYNGVLAEIVAAYLEERRRKAPSSRIRILEIGAGSGASTEVVLQKLEAYRDQLEEYCYTDISNVFLRHAQKEYGSHHPYLTYRLFDVEAPLAGQQIEVGSYDLVIAANVLHATKNIRTSLRNAKAVLKGNGLLLLNEIAEKSLLSHVTFGLLEGWWLYEDKAVRIPGCPGLACETWRSVLQQEGFRSVFFPAQQAHALGQQIIVAESDGVIRQPRGLPLLPEVPSNGNQAQATAQFSGDSRRRLGEILSDLLNIPAGELDPMTPLERYGLDSIVTLEFSRALRPEFGEIPPAVIFEHPTISALAAYLDSITAPAQLKLALPPELLLLHAGKQPATRSRGGVPSFWIHGAPGYAQVFRALTQDAEHPLYAFQARGIDGASIPFSDLGIMADYYCQCMARIVPGQRVLLGGYSLGGVIALEVARRWQAAGNPVAHLVLLDTYPNTPEVERLFTSLRDQGFYQILLANMFLSTRGCAPVQIAEADLAEIPDSLRLGELARLVSQRNSDTVSEHDVYRALLGTSAVSNFTGEAFRHHTIEPYSASDVLFVRASRGFVLPEDELYAPIIRQFQTFDYIAPWREIVQTQLTVRTLDTDHFSLLDSQGATQVRRWLKELE